MKREFESGFSHLAENHAWAFSEALTLKGKEGFFYLSDMDTYEMRLISAKHPEELNPSWAEYQGKKCYEVLQGRTSPCPFCTNHLLSKERYHIWTHYNPRQGRRYLLKDRLVDWKGKTMRLEEVLDISRKPGLERALLDAAEQYNLLRYWLALLAQEGTERVSGKVLQSIRAHFGADCCFIYPFDGMETEADWKIGRGAEFLQSPPSPEAREEWARILAGGKQVLIQDTAALERKDPESYRFLTELGVSSACFTPIFSGERLLGMIGLGNLSHRWEGVSLLKMLAMGVGFSIRQAILNEENLRIQFIDPLTGYQSYEGFKRSFEKLRRENPGRKYSLWYCDIKRFKYINDIFGFDMGDRLLRHWCDLVAADTREGETFCRISADNLISLRYYDNIEEMRRRFADTTKRLTRQADLAERRFTAELVSGVYLLQEHDEFTLEEMTDRANIAQKSVKSLPGSRIAFFTEEMRRKALREMTLETQMREGLLNEEFQLYMQPQMDLSGLVKGILRAEVLVRWRRQNGHNPTLPGEFIGLFEKNGMIVELDHYIFTQSCKLLRRLLDQSPRSLCFSVNVSRVTMLQPEFVSKYCQIKDLYRIPDGCLELEFTENGVVEDMEAFAGLVVALKNQGFLCAMDDFGAGQSSLNVLQRLPLDTLKLDREFFDKAQDRERNETVVSCVLQMARLLHMNTVAEGIETVEQAERLRKMGCDYIQGYVFARPMPAEEFSRSLLEGSL